MKWISNEDGSGQGWFEEGDKSIKFEKFSDYFYIQQLLDKQKVDGVAQGRRDALKAMTNFVGGAL